MAVPAAAEISSGDSYLSATQTDHQPGPANNEWSVPSAGGGWAAPWTAVPQVSTDGDANGMEESAPTPAPHGATRDGSPSGLPSLDSSSNSGGDAKEEAAPPSESSSSGIESEGEGGGGSWGCSPPPSGQRAAEPEAEASEPEVERSLPGLALCFEGRYKTAQGEATEPASTPGDWNLVQSVSSQSETQAELEKKERKRMRKRMKNANKRRKKKADKDASTVAPGTITQFTEDAKEKRQADIRRTAEKRGHGAPTSRSGVSSSPSRTPELSSLGWRTWSASTRPTRTSSSRKISPSSRASRNDARGPRHLQPGRP